MKLFHVELRNSTIIRNILNIFIVLVTISCITQQQTVEIRDYTLLDNGKVILGRDKGLTAFLFEGNRRKIPFQQFVADKYGVGSYNDISYDVIYEDQKFKVFVYEYSEIEKYFNVSQFVITMDETEQNIKGTTAKFIALSIVNNANEDCLEDGSLYQQIAIKYLKNLKDEYYNL